MDLEILFCKDALYNVLNIYEKKFIPKNMLTKTMN